MIIKDNINVNNTIQRVKQYYSLLFENCENIHIYASTNFQQDVKLFSNKEYENNHANGLYIEPNIINNPVILIKYELFGCPGCPEYGVILHELVHSSDYQKFCNDYCDMKWDALRVHKLFPTFYFWSEYHARIIEINHARILLSIIHPDYKYNKEWIRKEMLNFNLPKYKEKFIDSIETDGISLYNIFIFYSEFYSCKLFENSLNIFDSIPSNIIVKFPILKKLYELMEPLQTYENATINFETINEFLQDYL